MIGDREGGLALVWVLLALTMLAAAVLLVASFVESRQVTSRYEHRTVVLTNLSDAAMAETLAELARDPVFPGVSERRFGNGTIWSSVGTTPLGLRLVTAVGEYDGWTSVIRAEVSTQGGPRVVKVERVQSAR